VARVAALLIRNGQILNGPVDLVESRPRTLQEVVGVYEKSTERRLHLSGPWILPVLKILRPVVFRWAFPTGASRVRLLGYFDRHDWVGNSEQIRQAIPGFEPVSMEDHMRTKC
jgi:hypothetical protein